MSTLLGAHCICFCFVANGNKYVISIRISGNQTEFFCYDAVVKYGKYVKWSVNIKTIENGLFANKRKLICSKRLSRIYFKHIGFFLYRIWFNNKDQYWLQDVFDSGNWRKNLLAANYCLKDIIQT